jgi:hypothetical protein
MAGMLVARKPSVWRKNYDVADNGRPLTVWEASMWRAGGVFTLDGQRYEVRSNAWGTRYSLTDQRGTQVALAEGAGRKHWTVTAGRTVYEFRRPSFWRREDELVVRGARAGYVKRVGTWRHEVVADLPGLPPPVQIFVLAVLITKWDRADAAGASAASG